MGLFGKKEQVEYQEVKQKLATIESTIAEMRQNFEAIKITVDQFITIGMETMATKEVKELLLLHSKVEGIVRELENLRRRVDELEASVRVATVVGR